MNREQRRASAKKDDRMIVKAITVEFEDGTIVNLDTQKVMIIDKATKAQLFQEVIEEKKA